MIFERWYFGLCWKLEISYRVIIPWRIFGFFWRICRRLYFCMVKYLSFHYTSFTLILFNVNGKATCDTPLVWMVEDWLTIWCLFSSQSSIVLRERERESCSTSWSPKMKNTTISMLWKWLQPTYNSLDLSSTQYVEHNSLLNKSQW